MFLGSLIDLVILCEEEFHSGLAHLVLVFTLEKLEYVVLLWPNNLYACLLLCRRRLLNLIARIQLKLAVLTTSVVTLAYEKFSSGAFHWLNNSWIVSQLPFA